MSLKFAASALLIGIAALAGAEARAQSAALGERLFRDKTCNSCHAEAQRRDDPARDLPSLATYNFTTFRSRVRFRPPPPRPSGVVVMPAFSEAAVSDDDLCSIFLYVRSLRRPAPSGDSRTTCFPVEAGAPTPPETPVSRGAPPAPSEASLRANRVVFPPVEGLSARGLTEYTLDCWGGRDAEVFVAPVRIGERRVWRFTADFLYAYDGAPAPHPPYVLYPGHCLWVGEAPTSRYWPAPRGLSRIHLYWDDTAPPRSARAHHDSDRRPRIAWQANNSNYNQFLNAALSDRQRVRFIVVAPNAQRDSGVLEARVLSAAVGRSPGE